MGRDEQEPTPQQWQIFEREVARVLQRLDPDAKVEHDARVTGELSGVTRQIDVLITGSMVGRPVVFATECKCYKERVGIGVVDEFVGKCLDVGASAGLLYTFSGCTADAKARADGARFPGIELRELPEEQGRDYDELLFRIKFGDCPNPNCITGDVQWSASGDAHEEPGFRSGTCDTCGTVAVECEECGDVTAIDGRTQCDSCEAIYEEELDRKGIPIGVSRVS